MKASASSKVTLNKSKVTLEVGKSIKLKVTPKGKKYVWTSVNKKIATVKSNGKVTAKSVGTAKVKVKVTLKNGTVVTKVCKIIVKKTSSSKPVATTTPTSTPTEAQTATTSAVSMTNSSGSSSKVVSNKEIEANVDIIKVDTEPDISNQLVTSYSKLQEVIGELTNKTNITESDKTVIAKLQTYDTDFFKSKVLALGYISVACGYDISPSQIAKSVHEDSLYDISMLLNLTWSVSDDDETKKC